MNSQALSLAEVVGEILGRTRREKDCLIFLGAIDTRGYGSKKYQGKTNRTHVLVAEHFIGPRPGKKVINHTCENRACVNYKHLEYVTNSENMMYNKEPYWPKCGHLRIGNTRNQGGCKKCYNANARKKRREAS